ncbi:MAG TPA: phytoene/squalene synthase family protein [Steroidobacteraceae bacterium]|nr:phytoene/squalene synthase family protein [Steroidobacteraceae bacterium]
MDPGTSDDAYQREILPQVSRTFALTIPQLPPALRTAVTGAYLLCRIADTIEDEPAIPPAETLGFLERFQDVVAGRAEAGALARDLDRQLSASTLPAERDLVSHMEAVVQSTARCSGPQRAAIVRCVELMCYGMPRFQSNASLRGLASASDLDDYCYYVAGVVGEMLTELFCEHSPAIAQRRAAMQNLAVSFAQGLQMTNILKDVWEDRSRGACWLPQEVFMRHGVDLSRLAPEPHDDGFGKGLRELLAVAHAHLRNALDYTLLIPRSETGIRRFCLWAVGLAVLTLRNIDANPRFTAGAQVKVSHAAVAMTRSLTDIGIRSDWILRRLFAVAARGLPLAQLPVQLPAAARRPAPTAAGSASSAGAAEDAERRRYGSRGA